MGVHDGHRERLREKFRKYGLDSFNNHEILELLLFYAIPRRNTNPIAHDLLNTFHDLDGVFDAPVRELCKIDGVGENTALLLKLIPQVARRYSMSKAKNSFKDIIKSSKNAGDYLIPLFNNELDEVVYIIFLDDKGKMLDTKLMFRGSVNSANVSIRKILEDAIAKNATKIIMSHNHVCGIAVPSKEDIVTTKRIRSVLSAADIELIDHIIVAGDDYVSMADSGLLN